MFTRGAFTVQYLAAKADLDKLGKKDDTDDETTTDGDRSDSLEIVSDIDRELEVVDPVPILVPSGAWKPHPAGLSEL